MTNKVAVAGTGEDVCIGTAAVVATLMATMNSDFRDKPKTLIVVGGTETFWTTLKTSYAFGHTHTNYG